RFSRDWSSDVCSSDLEIYALEKEIKNYTLETLPRELLLEAKQKGFADRQIAHMLNCLESQVYKLREDKNIKRVYKMVDTCAAEFVQKTQNNTPTLKGIIKIPNAK